MMKKYRVKLSNFVFGVPMGFLGYKYNAEQFEIIGLAADKRCDDPGFIKASPVYLDEGHKSYIGFILECKAVYARVLIKFK